MKRNKFLLEYYINMIVYNILKYYLMFLIIQYIIMIIILILSILYYILNIAYSLLDLAPVHSLYNNVIYPFGPKLHGSIYNAALIKTLDPSELPNPCPTPGPALPIGPCALGRGMAKNWDEPGNKFMLTRNPSQEARGHPVLFTSTGPWVHMPYGWEG